MDPEDSNEMNEEKKPEEVAMTSGESGVHPPEEEQVLDEGQEEGQEPEEVHKQAEGDNLQSDKVDDEDPFSENRIQRILDIELPVNVSFGSTRRTLSEVLKLGPGALLELDRDADEPVILKVNNKIFAKGEIVDVDGYYGVQITEISSPAQRIVSLGE